MTTRKFTPENITKLEPNEVFVFGSNMNGNHAGGAARTAVELFGAINGQAEGLQGQSYALPTLDKNMNKLPLNDIKSALERLYSFAQQNTDKTFYVTLIGCGIAGFKVEDIKPLFYGLYAPNVILPKEFSIIKGIKGFNENMRCRNFQFEVGKEYTVNNDKPIDLCSDSVFHFCESLQQVHEHYSCNDYTHCYCEVEALSDVITDGQKCGAKTIRLIREITGEELNRMKGVERGNSGLFNSGDLNSGDLNSGDLNSGYLNSGDRNSGYLNSGDLNSGDRNSGDRNSGDLNSGDLNSGYLNSGDLNSGYLNSGDRNSGDLNSGYLNSGDRNSGDLNSGYRNSGDLNSGYLNSGDRNSGDLNSGYRNSGVFCTRQRKDTIVIFDLPCNMTWDEWYNHPVYNLCYNLTITKWVEWDNMSDVERKEVKSAYVCGGYLKVFEYKEAWANMWDTFTESDRALFKTLPNWNADKFEFITGIRYE